MQVVVDRFTVSLPMPIFIVVEDVGWWEGADGSAKNEPFRNGFPRNHCLDDYRVLVRLAKRLKMRIAMGMVLGEWDRSNLLRDIVGATWKGKAWDNKANCGPWLEEAADFLRSHSHCLEFACHGLCHEFWENGLMQRSEFHDGMGRMRPGHVVRSHLEAFLRIYAESNLPGNPRLFLPPALLHSFGNDRQSMQAILNEYGFRHVVTMFSRARNYCPPLHEKITWECGVGLMERGTAPVSWHEAAASPKWDFANPILPLHWGNLLHVDPEKNQQVVDGWADMLEIQGDSMEYLLAPDFISCWRQAAAHHLVKLVADGQKITLDLRELAKVPGCDGAIILKIDCPTDLLWRCRGGEILSRRKDPSGVQTIELCSLPGCSLIEMELFE